jgi:hypothetical protein
MVMVGVGLGMAVSVGGGVGVAVLVGGIVCVAVAGTAEGVAGCVARTGKLQARAIRLSIRNKKMGFRIPLFYNLFCVLHPYNCFV